MAARAGGAPGRGTEALPGRVGGGGRGGRGRAAALSYANGSQKSVLSNASQ